LFEGNAAAAIAADAADFKVAFRPMDGRAENLRYFSSALAIRQ